MGSIPSTKAPAAPAMGVYAITNTKTGAQYVGSTTHLRACWRVHRRLLRLGQHTNDALQSAWATDGAQSFNFSVLEVVTDAGLLTQTAQLWKATLRPRYNGPALAAHQWGTTLDDLRPYGDWQTRFWAKVDQSGECWLWTGARFRDGYGSFTLGQHRKGEQRHVARAHRLAYLLEHGAIPQGAEICHRCDQPACVRPVHLFAASHLDNQRDMMAKGRLAPHWSNQTMRGSRNPQTHLTEADIPLIRARCAAGESLKAVGADYGLGQSAVSAIVRRRTWAHVP